MNIASKKSLKGFVNVGTLKPILQEKIVSPSTSVQIVTPDTDYDGLSQVTVEEIPTTIQATPSISVNSSGLITASSTQSAGYVSSGTKSATKQLTTRAAETITPSTLDQSIASGVYLAGAQTIKGDANLIADNIKSGTSIFGVTGTYVDSTPIEISTDAGMEAVLTSDNVGKVYKFTGTSDTYTNGDLYIVEVG